jgi:glutamate-1-semialdehyde 2,1-aminomutase
MVGHSHPEIVEGVKKQLESGTNYGADPVEAYEVAEELAKRFRLDMVRFSNSGAESTMHALRFARAHTGKSKVIKFEGHYHGANDYLAVGLHPQLAPVKPMHVPSSPGIPEYVWKNTLVARFNDLNSVNSILRKEGGDVAALILEPVAMNMGVVPPEEGFLEGLRELTEAFGVVLIFDEVKTGVKLAWGGATEFFGVDPDMVCVAKSIGGGFTISAIIGRREIMSKVGGGGVLHAGTFNANPVSIKAAKITLKKVLKPEVYGPTHALSEKLAEGYREILEDEALEAGVQSIGVNGHLYTGLKEKVKDYSQYLRQDHKMWYRYLIAMMNRGIIPEAMVSDDQWTLSIQYAEEDIEATLEAFKEVAKVI